MWSEGNRRCDERCSTTSEGKKIEGIDWGVWGGAGLYSIGTKETAKLRKGRMDRKSASREWSLFVPGHPFPFSVLCYRQIKSAVSQSNPCFLYT